MANPSCSVCCRNQVSGQDRRTLRSRPASPADQVRMPLLASRNVLADHFQNSHQGLFQRGVASEHGVHECHALNITLIRIPEQLGLVVNSHGLGEMAAGRLGVGQDVPPAIVAHAITCRSGAIRSRKPPRHHA